MVRFTAVHTEENISPVFANPMKKNGDESVNQGRRYAVKCPKLPYIWGQAGKNEDVRRKLLFKREKKKMFAFFLHKTAAAVKMIALC